MDIIYILADINQKSDRNNIFVIITPIGLFLAIIIALLLSVVCVVVIVKRCKKQKWATNERNFNEK